ncbi:hypothetical protein OSH11_09660 [Kaistia dalseonensis]|uniref:Uncharacterized protein n=1 Tax=Kaistia dalseonensis TaxID=410840 RepID=A0ABU0H5H3_9HYPH|nr:hypothetical protein [Kaistia dalseonensis]MCX5494970.1 hypothetical protein [Kaistia dalseonensis]MDQ0437551.1 hypothetical protein [Kaistia dalseonensis]
MASPAIEKQQATRAQAMGPKPQQGKTAAMRIAEIRGLRRTPGAARPNDNLTDAIRAIVDPVAGVDLDLPERLAYREPPRFDLES